MKTILDGFSHRVTRRDFVARASLTCAGAALLPMNYVFGDTSRSEFVEVDTAYGRIRGAKGEGLTTFKGIPYAGPVSGANRFKAAPPLAPWTGVRDALELGAPSMQPGGQRRNEPPSDENCLFLNVWTPGVDGRKRPVMLYSHGGGFTSISIWVILAEKNTPLQAIRVFWIFATG